MSLGLLTNYALFSKVGFADSFLIQIGAVTPRAGDVRKVHATATARSRQEGAETG